MAPSFEARSLLLLLYIFVLHALAIFFFTRGFLLSRNELPVYSHCDDVDLTKVLDSKLPSLGQYNEDVIESRVAPNAGDDYCWTYPVVKKVIIIVLDALRFDFVVPADDPKPWMNRLQVLHRLTFEDESHGLLFKFIADPPTTSLQRLKGLTTGSLPTFIDIGNSFGAPAIVEDNIIHQLSTNGKKVIMMGDDTWLKLFPTEFTETFPFPSFNVKDLDTVDDGVVKHLFPALREEGWDMIIGHFLGVDHAGHIFGVESPQMIDKLEQYNNLLVDVMSILKNESYPGGLHEDTLLLVMGDHGQTLNGDHGGGTAEEVETALFAWSTRWPVHFKLKHCLSCNTDSKTENKPCIHEFQQLDFAATIAVILGVPIPFGSIGQINPQLLCLLSESWASYNVNRPVRNGHELQLKWMAGYHRLLHLNSWQVNRYFEQYTKSVLNSFPANDILNLRTLYAEARSAFQLFSIGNLNEKDDSEKALLTFSDEIRKYTRYLDAAAVLARSKWTHFADDMMAFGLFILFISVFFQIIFIYKFRGADPQLISENSSQIFLLRKMAEGSIVYGMLSAIVAIFVTLVEYSLYRTSSFLSWNQIMMAILGGSIFGSAKPYIFSKSQCGVSLLPRKQTFINQIASESQRTVMIFFCVIHACSLLSNSFILKEQQVITFFLLSSGFYNLRHAVQQNSKVPQSFASINPFKDVGIQTNETESNPTFPAAIEQLFVICVTVYVPLIFLGFYSTKKLWGSTFLQSSSSWLFFLGVPTSFMAIFLHWFVGDIMKLQLLSVPDSTREISRLQIPQIVYGIGSLQTVLLVYMIQNTDRKSTKVQLRNLLEDVAMLYLSIWSSLILLLLGRQGPLIAFIAAMEGWCLIDMQSLCSSSNKSTDALYNISDYAVANLQWSLFAVQIFFSTGHRCAFDGLRYAAAFIGFDHFNIYRQGILLAIDTFGASHMLTVAGLVLMVAKRNTRAYSDAFYKSQMFQTFLMYGLARTVTTVFSTVCVTIQRRHLMVWGLFAPKFVFDVVSLLLTDAMLVLFYALCIPILK